MEEDRVTGLASQCQLGRSVCKISELLLVWAHENRIVLYIVGALVLGIAIGRFRSYRGARWYWNRDGYGYQNSNAHVSQHRGERLLSNIVHANFSPPHYHLMNHVTVLLNDGSTQIDHILVSRFGVFVIETKHYKGWIFADAGQANWTQVLFKRKFKFQNPVHQNYRHVLAVQRLLDFLPSDAIKSVVVFTGEAEFKTEIPPGVFTISSLIEYLRGHTIEVMSLNRMQFCVGRIETMRLAISGRTDVEHIRSLERRHGRAIPYSHERRKFT
jgi:hypothetical protein